MDDLDSEDLKNLHNQQLLTQDMNVQIFSVLW